MPGPAAITAIVIVLAAWYLNAAISWRQAALFLVGAGAGVVLYHAAFGFTSSWRVFISDRRGAGLRAQMLMLAITCAVFFPLLAAGTCSGQPLRGSVSPIGVGVAAGAFIFGLGMQLGGGCASGTLFSVGGGSTRMLVTLFFFIIGSVIGTAHMGWWTAQPAFPATSLVTTMGPWVGAGGEPGALRRASRGSRWSPSGSVTAQLVRRNANPARWPAMADRTVAARRRRRRPRGRQHRAR